MRHLVLILLLLAPLITRSAEEKPMPQHVIHGVAQYTTAREQTSLSPGLSMSMTWAGKLQTSTYHLTERIDGKIRHTFGEDHVPKGKPYLLHWDATRKTFWFITQKTITKIPLANGLEKAVPFALANSRHVSLPDMPEDLARANADLLRSTAAATTP